jgi:hypothetical protein
MLRAPRGAFLFFYYHELSRITQRNPLRGFKNSPKLTGISWLLKNAQRFSFVQFGLIRGKK